MQKVHGATAFIAAAGLAVLTAWGPAAAPASASDSDGTYHVHPIARGASSPGISPTLTPADCLEQTGGVFSCHTPESIRAAYNVPETINGEPAGAGETVVIVVAFGSPTVESDLEAFSAKFGLPSADLEIHYPGGKPTWNGRGTQVEWAAETSLDVQWAHAVAPGAKIALVVAANDRGASLDGAVRYAVDQRLGNVLSMSYSQPEATFASLSANNGHVLQAQRAFRDAAAIGMSVFASAGDRGADSGLGIANAAYPASDENVTAVGGTTLWVGSGVELPRETVWGDYSDCPLTCAFGSSGATGGAPSLVSAKQGSDVAYNASPYTGVYVHFGFLDPGLNGFYPIGGTSAGAPQWAALTAVVIHAVGHAVGNVREHAASWAERGALHDVTQGSNATSTFPGGFDAAPGWDRPTGWGTPDVRAIIAASR